MIIFDLDGTLADCEHRRHFVDPSKIPFLEIGEEFKENDLWKPDWKAFYEACDKDKPIRPVFEIINNMLIRDQDVHIWSGRCKSVKEKSIHWLKNYLDVDEWFYRDCLKMRPIGDSTPDEKLKERWYDLHNVEHPRENIEFVFDDRPKVIRMWRRRGIFVFNCSQHKEEF